jgi:hypothetical protein
MHVTGPAPIVPGAAAPAQRPEDAALQLRINQRFAAEVLQVSGERVLLALDGVRIVARMVSAEQAASLAERRFAQFIVKDSNSSLVTLQVLHPEQGAVQGQATQEAELIPNLLRIAGLPVNQATVEIARGLLNQGLQVNPELVQALQRLLAQTPHSSAAAAQAAAALKALGLPLSAEALALALQSLPPLDTLLAGLQSQLRSLARARPALAPLAEKALAILDGLVLRLDGADAPLAEQLKRAISLMGRSSEHLLAERAGQSPPPQANLLDSQNLLALAALRRELGEQAPASLLDDLDRFLDGMRLLQYLNAEPEEPPLKDRWLRLELPFVLDGQPPPGSPPSDDALALRLARLRVAFQEEAGRSWIDPGNTRFILRVDLDQLAGAIQVDVSVAGRRLGAHITASNPQVRILAEKELGSLLQALENHGYLVQNVRFDVAALDQAQEWGSSAPWKAFAEVSREV